MLSGGMVFIFNEIFVLLVVSVGCVTATIGQECRNVTGGCEVSVLHPVILLSIVRTTRQSFPWVHVRREVVVSCHSVTWSELNQSVSVNLYVLLLL